MAAHLRRYLPGLTHAPADESPSSLALLVGRREFAAERGHSEYVALPPNLFPYPTSGNSGNAPFSKGMCRAR